MATLQKKNRLHCTGRYSAATPPVVEATGTGDWTVVRNGAGDTTVTMGAGIDTLERAIFVTSRVISNQASVVAGTDTTFQVQNLSDAAGAVDTAIDFLVIRIGG